MCRSEKESEREKKRERKHLDESCQVCWFCNCAIRFSFWSFGRFHLFPVSTEADLLKKGEKGFIVAPIKGFDDEPIPGLVAEFAAKRGSSAVYCIQKSLCLIAKVLQSK